MYFCKLKKMRYKVGFFGSFCSYGVESKVDVMGAPRNPLPE